MDRSETPFVPFLERFKKLLYKDKTIKISTILEEFSFEEILHFFSCFSTIVNNYFKDKSINIDNDDLKTFIVGAYKPGGFLGHFLNLSLNMNKVILLFQANPYLVLNPKFDNFDVLRDKNIIFLDESIKTGFTYILFDNLFFRMANEQPKSYIFTLFDYIKFDENRDERLNNNLLTIFRIKDEREIECNEKIKDYYSKQECERNSKNVEGNLEKIENSKNVKQRYVDKVKEHKNIFLIFCSTEDLLMISLHFAEIIKRDLENTGKEEILLYSVTQAGKLLSFFVLFAFKYLLYKENYTTKKLRFYLDLPKFSEEESKAEKAVNFYEDSIKYLIESSIISNALYIKVWMSDLLRFREKNKVDKDKIKIVENLSAFRKIFLVKKPSYLDLTEDYKKKICAFIE